MREGSSSFLLLPLPLPSRPRSPARSPRRSHAFAQRGRSASWLAVPERRRRREELRLVPGIPEFGQNGQQTKSTRDVVSDTATFGGEQDQYGRVGRNLLEP